VQLIKEVANMSDYKQPQVVPTPSICFDTDPNTLKASDVNKKSGTPRVSMGDPGRNEVKSTGVAQRGKGAATKGFTSRGPLA
jgi:hypothetical protein